MNRSVFTKWLWDSRRSLIGWAIAIAFAGCGYAAFWPTMNTPEVLEFLDTYPAAVLEALNYTDIATADGYLNATVYGLVVAVLMLVFAIGAGTRIVAGDEEAGTLELILAHPVSRTRVALERFAAFTVAVLLIMAVFWVLIRLVAGPAQFGEIPATRFVAMHVHLASFALLFGALAFAVGAATGRRALALAVGAGAGLLAYAASGIIPQVERLAWVKDYSPFTWLNGSMPLRNGIDLAQVGLMLGLAVALVALGTWAFQRRDIAT